MNKLSLIMTTAGATGVLLLALCRTAAADNAAPAHVLEYQPRLSLAIAERIIDACMEKQRAARSSTVAIAVFDSAGILVAFKRMANVSPGAVNAALGKGKSAAVWGHSTRDMSAWVAQNSAVSHLPDLIGVTGGVPVKTDRGFVVGGVGVSGAPADEDEACALAGLRAAENMLREKNT